MIRNHKVPCACGVVSALGLGGVCLCMRLGLTHALVASLEKLALVLRCDMLMNETLHTAAVWRVRITS
jgi:hypothetical protein